ncbi:hypothetical protein LCGC14_1677180 [marine sediment metagenome]|uniref:Uncharacterized protein n=1 Tax=marine sediment metagenome TaxID=412755 RepID=A0A0F9HPS3_9ZZZZ
MREFDTGATRNTSDGKLGFVRALCPLVLERYVKYLDKHREQADGKFRPFDNWKKGIPDDVYLDSLGRHFFDVWKDHGKYIHKYRLSGEDVEDSLCAVMFNAMGLLHNQLLKGAKHEEPKKEDSPVA